MRLSFRTKLLGSIALDLALMIALGVFALNGFSNVFQKASMIEQITIPSLDLSDRINFISTKYHALQLEYIINNSAADKSRIEGEMQALEQQMDAAFAAYRQLDTTMVEGETLNAVAMAWQRFVQETNEQFLPTARLSNTGSVQPALNRLNPYYEDVLSATDILGQLSQNQANEALASVGQTFESVRLVIYGEIAFTVLLSGAIGLMLATRTARRIRNLTDATVAVAGGDLERTVQVRGGDELQTLASNFNSMVRSLREHRDMLELRNAELAESLYVQQQLTEDIIRRKQAEEMALRAQAAAEAASQAKSMFVATMSHELRTPLNAILGYTQLLHLGAKARGQEDVLPQLERIRLAGKHLLTLVSNVLDFSKIEHGKMNLDLGDVQLASLVDEVMGIVQPLAEARFDQLTTEFASTSLIYSDGGKIRQILFNLLSNAIKFTEAGTVTLRVWDEQRAGEPWLVFAVSDTGIGMAPDQLRRLFKPFVQADESTTRTYGGTGLGLALSQQLAAMLGGSISVESCPNVGSTFTLQIPVQCPEQSEATLVMAASPLVNSSAVA
ncbi:ATP-binding protein [Herpetosiphon gulosus]|uniref:histidine kinase n=1 Tax=Herpetosiphon gulosus TaxID=1973496 RepID=A0ABP9X1K6_9CHLR